MNRRRWLELKSLFQEALDLEGEDREAFLDRLGTADPEARTELASLLGSHRDSASFLERPPSRVAAAALAAAEVGSEATDPPTDESSPLAGRRLGPYKIVRRIGHGGLGSVYLAEREEEFTKRVAIKLIRRTVATPELLRRFQVERQILASIEHPNIARLLDGGTTEEGWPYLVMEYIEGEPLDRYCDANRLGIKLRLELFLSVCRAVEVAHQSLVVHCDIKPDNVLVTADGAAKLLDFGIARLLEAEGDSHTEDFGRRILTPEYSSPEQLRGERLTTATDVYSLGVLLYELLTGNRPHSLADLPLDEAAQLVAGTKPQRPSKRCSSAAARVAVEKAGDSHTAFGAGLERQLASDLDAIALAALEPDARSRYSAVDQLAADVRRFLDGFPVSVRPATLGYRLRKFTGRHRLAVASATASILVLMALVAMLATQSLRLDRARDYAEREAAAARTVSAFLQEMLTRADPFEGLGGEATVLEALDLAVAGIDDAFAGQESLEAAVRDAAGMTYLKLGRYDAAEPQLRRSLEIRRSLGPGAERDLARSFNSVGLLERELGNYERAEELFRSALDLARRVEREDRSLTVETMGNLASVLHDRNDLDAAEALYRESLMMQRSDAHGDQTELAATLDGLGEVLAERGRPEAAEKQYREALAIRRHQLDSDHPEISTSLNNIASALQDQGELTQAETLYRESLEIARRVFGDEHPEVASAINNLATVLNDSGDLEEAELLYRQSLAVARRLYGDEHPEIAIGIANLATLLHDTGRLDEAEFLYRQSIDMSRRFHGTAHPLVATGLMDLADLLEERGDLDAAERTARQALGTTRQARGAEHRDVAVALAELAALVCSRRGSEPAQPLFDEALTLATRIDPTGNLAAGIRDDLASCRAP